MENGEKKFSPNCTFDDLKDAEIDKLIDAFIDRMKGWYFQPLKSLLGLDTEKTKGDYDFISLAIECMLIDALAGYFYGIERNTGKCSFIVFLIENLGFKSYKEAEKFYEDFRCGIVHETRIKKSGFVSRKEKFPHYWIVNDKLYVNPVKLFTELKSFFIWYCDKLLEEDKENIIRKNFLRRFRYLFKDHEELKRGKLLERIKEELKA